MDYYGLNLKNYLKLFEVDTLPIFSLNYNNCAVFDKETGRSYIGNSKLSRWISFDLSQNSVKSYSLDLDVELELTDLDKISAKTLPVKYNENKTNIQDAIDDIFININNLSSGLILQNDAIRCHHIDKDSTFKIDSECLKTRDKLNIFSPSGPKKVYVSIDDAVNTTYNKTLDKSKFTEDTEFGDLMGFDTSNAESAFKDIEDFLSKLSGLDIKVNCNTCPDKDKTKLQFVVDDVYTKFEKNRIEVVDAHDKIKITDNKLIDTKNKLDFTSLKVDEIFVRLDIINNKLEKLKSFVNMPSW